MRNEIGIAPGLSVSVDVEFLTRHAGDFSDKLVVLAEDFRCDVDLIAETPKAVARKGEATASRPAEVAEKAWAPSLGRVEALFAGRRIAGRRSRRSRALWRSRIPTVIPLIKVNPDMLHFGECPVNHRSGSQQLASGLVDYLTVSL